MSKKYNYGKYTRIRDKSLIEKIMREGKIYRNEYLKIYFLAENEKKFTVRLQHGIKGGYKRNRLRRRLREIMRIMINELKDGYYIVKGNKKAIDMKYNELKEAIKEITEEGELCVN